MATMTRVRVLRTVQGEGSADAERPIHVKGSVEDLRSDFAAELIASNAAEAVDEKDVKCVKVPLHPAAADKAPAK